MSNGKIAIAVLDIGTTGVRMLVGRIMEKGTPKIIAKAECSATGTLLPEGDLVHSDLNRCLSSVLDSVLKKTGIEVRSCYVSLSNKFVHLVSSSGRISIPAGSTVTGLNVGELLNEASSVEYGPDEVLVDVIPVAYYADGELLTDKPEGTVCSVLSLDANAVIADSKITEKITGALSDLNLKVDGFIPTFFSDQKVFDASSFLGAKNRGCFTAIADVGGVGTDISVYYNGIPFAFSAVKQGGNNITRDLEKVLSVGENRAYRLKMEHCAATPEALRGAGEGNRPENNEDGSVDPNLVVDVMNARLLEIAEKTGKETLACMERAGVSKPAVDKFYFVGDGIVHFRGIDRVLEEAVTAGEVSAVDKGKDLGIKNSFTTALGMMIFIASKIKYGRKASDVVNRNETTEQRPEKKNEADAENLTFWKKVRRFFFGDQEK